jgi:hypothetical protein
VRATALRELRDEERRLARLAGRIALPFSLARLSASSGRVNWRQVLDKLPKQFKTADLRKVAALKYKPPSENLCGN